MPPKSKSTSTTTTPSKRKQPPTATATSTPTTPATQTQTQTQTPTKFHLSHPATLLLRRAHSPESAQTILVDKVLKRPLLLKPTTERESDPVGNARAKRHFLRLRKAADRKKKLKPKPLSSRQRRALGIHDIDVVARSLRGEGGEGKVDYEVFVPLHGLWVGYMWEILGLTRAVTRKEGNMGVGDDGVVADSTAVERWSGISSAQKTLLVSADYHGAEIEVVRSRCVSRVGVKGIVVRDTKYTFVVVVPPSTPSTPSSTSQPPPPSQNSSKEDGEEQQQQQQSSESETQARKGEIKTLPKEHTVFRITIPFPSLPPPPPAAAKETSDEAGGKKEAVQKKDPETSPDESKVDKSRKIIFELHGDQFQHRATDRANKKFKPHFLPTL